MSLLNSSTISIDSITDVVDALPLDSIPDLDSVIDVVSGAAGNVGDTALVAGARTSRVAVRAVHGVWNNRREAAFIIVVLAAVAAFAAWKNQSDESAPLTSA